MPKNNKEKAISGFLWLGFEKIISYFITLIITMILSRLLTSNDFGVVASVQIVISFTDILSFMGLGPAIIQKKELTDDDIITANILNILLGIVMYGIIFTFSKPISSFVGIVDVRMLNILAIVFLLHSLSGISSALLRRDMRFRTLSVIYLVSQISYGIVAILLAFLGFGPWALIAGRLVLTATLTIIKLWIMPLRIKPQINWTSAKELVSFGSGITLTNVFNNFALQGDNWVASRYLGATMLGFYNRAYTLFSMPTSMFGSLLNSVLFPLLSKFQDRHKKIAYVYLNLNALIALLSFPVSIFLFFSAREIIQIVLGDGWDPVVGPFKVLIICLFFRSSYKISVSTINSLGAIYKRLWTQVLYAASVIGGAIIGKEWGIIGIATTTSISMFINYLVLSLLVKKLIEFKLIDLKNYLLPIVLVNIVLVGLSYTLNLILYGVQSDIIRIIILAFTMGISYMLAYKYFIIRWMPPEFNEFVSTIIKNSINNPFKTKEIKV
jgi:O-antigen/teichoic acid export membrane protein